MTSNSFRSTELLHYLALKALHETTTPLHIIDENLTIIFCNNALETLSRGRVRVEDVIGIHLYDVFSFLRGTIVEEEYKQAFAGEIVQSEDVTNYANEIIYTETTKVPLRDPSGEIKHVLTLIRDISPRKKVLKQLEDLTERQEKTIQERTRALKIQNQGLKALIEIQQSLEKALNVEEIFNIVIKNVRQLIRCEEVSVFLLTKAGDFRLAAKKTYHSKKPQTKEKPVIPRNESILTEVIKGTKPILRQNLREEQNLFKYDYSLLEEGIISDLSVPLISSTGPIGVLYFGSTKDPLKPENTPLALDLAKPIGIALGNAVLFDALVRSNREYKYYLDLLSITMQENLHSITNFLQCINQPMQDEHARDIRAEIRDAQNLLQKVQTLNAIIHGQYSEMKLDLTQVLGRTIAQILSRNDDTLFYLDIPDHPCIIQADPLIDDLFLNLFSNALKFNTNPQKVVRVTLSKASQGYTVFIDDEGIGIPDERKVTLLEEAENPSTELGLVIVRRLVEKYQGRISVTNRVPEDYTRGTRFIVFFPHPSKRKVRIVDYSRLQSS
ncbi:MAG: ATP-binding protein [Candidatus Hermodarchaeota archaeon]